jgi:hypothetical protein
MTQAIESFADGDCVVAETEIQRNSNQASDAQIIDLIKSLSSTDLKKWD